jgi:hypothetical protein
VFAVATLAASASGADTRGLFLPSPPSGPGGQDSVESATGTRCSQSMNSNGAYFDLGFALAQDVDDGYGYGYRNVDDFDDDSDMPIGGMAYARVVIPLGEQPERIDCARLYELELRRLQAEIELLRMGLE